MSPANTSTKPIQQVLDLLEKVRASGEGWSALCPAHDDRNNSLSIREGDDGRILLKCHAGCDVNDILEALGLDLQNLFVRTRTKQRKKLLKSGGLTVEEYAEAKGLPVKFLRKHGVDDFHLRGTNVVRIPYRDEQGQLVAVRFRHSMRKEPRFTWRAGDKLCLYGLSRLKRARKRGYVCLVEGESDAQTLWLQHFPAVALPGAATWHEDWVEHFHGIENLNG
jgi:DNA primase